MLTQTRVCMKYMRYHFEPALFITLTCKGEVADVVAQHGLSNFWLRMKRAGMDCSRYLVAREYQQRGVVHYHILLFGVRFIPYERLERVFWGLGDTNIKPARDAGALRYLMKYVGKGRGATLHCSRGLAAFCSARSEVIFWRRVGHVLRRYWERMAVQVYKLHDDSAALRVMSRAIWDQEVRLCPLY